jgi:hypothetical protein
MLQKQVSFKLSNQIIIQILELRRFSGLNMDLIGGLLQSFGSLFENNKKIVDFIDKKTLLICIIA